MVINHNSSLVLPLFWEGSKVIASFLEKQLTSPMCLVSYSGGECTLTLFTSLLKSLRQAVLALPTVAGTTSPLLWRWVYSLTLSTSLLATVSLRQAILALSPHWGWNNQLFTLGSKKRPISPYSLLSWIRAVTILPKSKISQSKLVLGGFACF